MKFKIGEKSEIVFEDKSANYIPWIVTGGFIFLILLSLFEKADLKFIIIFILFTVGMFIYFMFFQPEIKPLQITKKGLIVTEDKKFLRKRVLVDFKDIKSIRVGADKRGSRMEFIYIIDKNGKKYFNVIFEVSKFKEALGNSLKDNITDFGPYSFLPKRFR